MKTYSPLFVSIEQPYLTDLDREILRHPFVGGIILFRKNFTEKKQIKELISEIKALKTPPLLISVDHEGGRVQRFTEGFTKIPAMHRIGQIYDENPPLADALAKACGYIIGTELGEMGVDFSFTPVLDLDYSANSVIGDRSFHEEPEAVVRLAGALIAGLAETGMMSVGKHFPGHGFVTKDSHLTLPQDSRDLSELERYDMIPFERLHAQLAGIMSAHVIYQNIDPNIATFSSFWLKEILRQKIGYQGLIFSDDLSMKALDGTSTSDRALRALKAGCNIILLCNDTPAVAAMLADESVISYQDTLDLSKLYVHPMSEPKRYQAALQTLEKCT